MFHVFQKQIQQSTGVENCIKANLTSKDDINLIISKTNVLQIYTIRYKKNEKNEQKQFDSMIDEKQPQQSKKIETRPCLDLILEKVLFGNIESLNVVRYPEEEKDSLVVTFRDAKLSILDFNVNTMDLEIRSIHYYEKDEYKFGRTHFKHPPFCRIDHSNRCAVTLLYDHSLAVLPFKQSISILDEDDDDNMLKEEEKEDVEMPSFEEMLTIMNKNPYYTQKTTPNTASKKSQSKANEKYQSLESYIVDLKSLGIDNIKDFCFLYGYYEPTLLILHEPTQTWTSRISTKRLTSVLTAIELSLDSQKKTSIIWNIDRFPYNCESLLPVPEPLGGAIVFTPNILFYVNQSTRYGLSVNEYANIDTGDQFSFPLDNSLNLVFTLERSTSAFLEPDRFICSLKGGELLIFHLISDGRSIQRVHVSKAGGSVLSSCMCVLSNNLIFLGSRLGESLLLLYTEKIVADNQDEHENFSNPYKKQKTSEVFDLFNDEDDEDSLFSNNTNPLDEDDEDDIFKEKKSQLKTYQLGICDHITNIGPITDMIIGNSFTNSDLDDDEDQSQNNTLIENDDEMLDLVTCSGYGKNGSIVQLHKNVKPDLLVDFNVPDVKNAWTLYYEPEVIIINTNNNNNSATQTSKDKEKEGKESTSKKRTFESMTNDVNEEKETTDNSTVKSEPEETDKNLHSYLFLSHSDSTSVYQTGDQLKEVGKFPQPTLTMSNIFGRKRIIQVHSNGIKLLNGHSSITQELTFPNKIAQCYIQDPFVLIQFQNGTVSLLQGNPKVSQLMEYKFLNDKKNIETSSLFLDPYNKFFSGNTVNNDINTTNPTELELMKVNLILIDGDGVMEIYKVFTKELLFKFNNHWNESEILHWHEEEINSKETTVSQYINLNKSNQHLHYNNSSNSNNNTNGVNGKKPSISKEKFVEISVHYLSNSNWALPYIVGINSIGDILIYQGFKSNQQVLFKKFNHNTITRDYIKKKDYESSRTKVEPTNTEPVQRRRRIIEFNNIAEKKGLFISGNIPVWIFCEKNYPRIHTMSNLGPINIFTSFQNVNCSNGFIYFNNKDSLCICQLPLDMNFENQFPIRKYIVKNTCHKIAYDKYSKCYSLILSYPVDPEDIQESDQRKPVILDYKYQVKLIDRRDLSTFIDSFSLQEKETVLSMKMVQLKFTDSDGVIRTKPFLTVGTAFTHGEDAQCKGRVLVFEIIIHIGQKRLNLLYEKEQKGPVTALSATAGYLLMTIGPKLIVNNFISGSLIGLAFFDAQIYIVNISTIKNLIVIGDMYKSVYFLKWKYGKQLELLSKDYQALNIFTTDYIINQKTLILLVADLDKNVLLFSYDPLDKYSRRGKMMLCKSDFHIASNIQRFIRTPLKVKNPSPTSNTKTIQEKQMVFGGTLDGGLIEMIPISERKFNILTHLQTKLSHTPQIAGLNPKYYRSFKSYQQQYSPSILQPQKFILDGDLIHQYLSLNITDKHIIASSINSNPKEIINILNGISLSSNII